MNGVCVLVNCDSGDVDDLCDTLLVQRLEVRLDIRRARLLLILLRAAWWEFVGMENAVVKRSKVEWRWWTSKKVQSPSRTPVIADIATMWLDRSWQIKMDTRYTYADLTQRLIFLQIHMSAHYNKTIKFQFSCTWHEAPTNQFSLAGRKEAQAEHCYWRIDKLSWKRIRLCELDMGIDIFSWPLTIEVFLEDYSTFTEHNYLSLAEEASPFSVAAEPSATDSLCSNISPTLDEVIEYLDNLKSSHHKRSGARSHLTSLQVDLRVLFIPPRDGQTVCLFSPPTLLLTCPRPCSFYSSETAPWSAVPHTDHDRFHSACKNCLFYSSHPMMTCSSMVWHWDENQEMIMQIGVSLNTHNTITLTIHQPCRTGSSIPVEAIEPATFSEISEQYSWPIETTDQSVSIREALSSHCSARAPP